MKEQNIQPFSIYTKYWHLMICVI